MKKKALSLKYDAKKYDAPIVTAKGVNAIAELIIKKAKEHNIPIKEDPVLTDILMTLEIGDSIPEELFKVIAEILAFIYTQNSKYEEILDKNLL